jgi:hypothetical protein
LARIVGGVAGRLGHAVRDAVRDINLVALAAVASLAEVGALRAVRGVDHLASPPRARPRSSPGTPPRSTGPPSRRSTAEIDGPHR